MIDLINNLGGFPALCGLILGIIMLVFIYKIGWYKKRKIDMNYLEAQEYSLTKEWKVSLCNEGEECWCRMIEPKEEILDDKGNEIYIAGSGSISKLYAEHIVRLHNESLKKQKEL